MHFPYLFISSFPFHSSLSSQLCASIYSRIIFFWLYRFDNMYCCYSTHQFTSRGEPTTKNLWLVRMLPRPSNRSTSATSPTRCFQINCSRWMSMTSATSGCESPTISRWPSRMIRCHVCAVCKSTSLLVRSTSAALVIMEQWWYTRRTISSTAMGVLVSRWWNKGSKPSEYDVSEQKKRSDTRRRRHNVSQARSPPNGRRARPSFSVKRCCARSKKIAELSDTCGIVSSAFLSCLTVCILFNLLFALGEITYWSQ